MAATKLGSSSFWGVHEMVHSLSEIWSAAATPPLWLSSQLTVREERPLAPTAPLKAKAPPLAALWLSAERLDRGYVPLELSDAKRAKAAALPPHSKISMMAEYH